MIVFQLLITNTQLSIQRFEFRVMKFVVPSKFHNSILIGLSNFQSPITTRGHQESNLRSELTTVNSVFPLHHTPMKIDTRITPGTFRAL